MYDMYSWDQPAGAADERAERPAPAPQPAGDDGRAARAVQVALDRRDNGGDAGPRRPA